MWYFPNTVFGKGMSRERSRIKSPGKINTKCKMNINCSNFSFFWQFLELQTPACRTARLAQLKSGSVPHTDGLTAANN